MYLNMLVSKLKEFKTQLEGAEDKETVQTLSKSIKDIAEEIKTYKDAQANLLSIPLDDSVSNEPNVSKSIDSDQSDASANASDASANASASNASDSDNVSSDNVSSDNVSKSINKGKDITMRVEVQTNEAKEAVNHLNVFAKCFSTPNASLSDPERNQLYDKMGRINLPDLIKTNIFGKNIAKTMNWFGKAVVQAKALNPYEESAGGALVPEEFERKLWSIPGENINLMDICDIKKAIHGSITIPRLDRASSPSEHGVAVSWTQSGSSKPETEPVFDQIKVDCYEVTAYVEIMDALIGRSAFDIINELSNMFRGAIKHAIDVAIIHGTGDATMQPLGILNTVGIGTHPRATAAEIDYTDVVGVKYAVNPRARAGGVFILQDEGAAFLEGTLATDGRPIFAASTATGPYDRLLGFPYMATVDCAAALGTEGDLIFANMAYYKIALESDVVIVSDNGLGLGFRTNRTNIKAFAKVGGRLIEPDAAGVLTDAI
jgi:HK97 family phage major capsid protein